MSARGQIFPAWTNIKVAQRAPSRRLSHARASGSMDPGRVALKERNIQQNSRNYGELLMTMARLAGTEEYYAAEQSKLVENDSMNFGEYAYLLKKTSADATEGFSSAASAFYLYY